MQVWTKKDKNGESYWCWFRKSSSDESDNEAGNDSNDETEFDDDKMNPMNNLLKAKKSILITIKA